MVWHGYQTRCARYKHHRTWPEKSQPSCVWWFWVAMQPVIARCHTRHESTLLSGEIDARVLYKLCSGLEQCVCHPGARVDRGSYAGVVTDLPSKTSKPSAYTSLPAGCVSAILCFFGTSCSWYSSSGAAAGAGYRRGGQKKRCFYPHKKVQGIFADERVSLRRGCVPPVCPPAGPSHTGLTDLFEAPIYFLHMLRVFKPCGEQCGFRPA